MPRKIRNEYDKKLTYNNLMKAHDLSKRGKGYRKDVILFELKKEEYIQYLYEHLKNQTYQHGGYTTFYIYEPKVRKIEKSRYIDRIVHRFVVDQFLEPYFVPTFIDHSYACLKGKGMHKATKYVQDCMKHCHRIWENYYILKMDIAKYFENINKDILFQIVSKKIEDEKVLWLMKEIIYSGGGKKSLQIGNYTSQMFANIYLNEVDQFIKHTLKIKYYARYLDDSILMVKTKEEAKNSLQKIKLFLKENLELEFNKKTQLFKSKQGVNFCGYKINENRLKIRDRGKRKLKKKVKKLKQEIKQGNINSKEAKKQLAGHMGYIKHANTYTLINKLFYIE